MPPKPKFDQFNGRFAWGKAAAISVDSPVGYRELFVVTE